MYLQRTIREKIKVDGIGLHTGKPASLVFCPAPENTGVHFVRRDLPGEPYISPKSQFVQATNMATTLGGKHFSVATVEHCLSAVAALRIDNLIIELQGPEIPIGDGSAQSFYDAIIQAGIVEQEQPRQYVRVTKPVYYGDGEKHAYIVPYNGLRITCEIFFEHPAIGQQKIDIDVSQHTFGKELAGARTFGFLKDVEILQKKGLALGGSLNNAIVLDQTKIINEDSLRWKDEFVRHKALDALGDLVNLGKPMLGHVILFRAGHDVMNRLIQNLLDSDHYQIMELGSDLPPLWKEKSEVLAKSL